MGVKIVNHMNMLNTTSSKTPAVSHSRKRPAFGLNILPVPFFRITKSSTLASHNKLFVSSTLRLDQYTMETENLTKSLGNSYSHPRKQSVDEIFKSMESWATDNILPMLKPAKECWQPHDFLPHPSSYGFHDQLRELQARTKDVPDDYFVVLVGNMITEEALPTYQARINATEIFYDQTGIDETPWAIWARGWSAEENRHGDLLNKYLYLSGRLDMKQVEITIQYLIAAGMDIGTSNNPYLWTIYTSFQERATAISHRNTAKLAMHHGDTKLAQICGIIASDEKRHESAYTKIAKKLFEIDPNGMLVAFAYMMRRKIGMPAQLMYDGKDENLFKHFSEVASRIGVYTAAEYRGVLEHLIGRWNVDKLTGLSSEGGEAQDYICGLPLRIAKLEEIRARTRVETAPTNVSFSWINNRDR